MKFNIIVKQGKEDSFDLPQSIDSKNLYISSLSNGQDSQSIISNNVDKLLNEFKLSSSENMTDFANLSLATYSADQLTSREHYGYYGWSRHLCVYLPVLEIRLWADMKEEFETLLSFLSGDKWELHFRKREKNIKPMLPNKN